MKSFLKKIVSKNIFKIYYTLVEFLIALFYGFPGKQLRIIGITGTKGKSSVVYLASKVFEASGYKVGATSSIEFKLGKKTSINKTKMTMPGRIVLQKFLRECVKQKMDYVILEITSEGLYQNRQKFINFETALFTNLFPEHIESHGSYENYKKAKGLLFKTLKGKGNAIINTSYNESKYYLNFKAKEKHTFKSTDKLPFKTHLIGDFNKENVLAVYNLARFYKIKKEIIKNALDKIKFIPGRLDPIDMGQDFKVYVDYAHMPAALERVLQALKSQISHPIVGQTNAKKVKNQKLIAIIGSQGSNRDKWKRPEMGRIAVECADIVIITNEDPYKDNPWQIIEDIYRGAEKIQNFKKQTKVIKILDREFAIKKAIDAAEKNDIVLISGKGREPWMETAKGKIPWSDAKIAEKYLKLKTSNKF